MQELDVSRGDQVEAVADVRVEVADGILPDIALGRLPDVRERLLRRRDPVRRSQQASKNNPTDRVRMDTHVSPMHTATCSGHWTFFAFAPGSRKAICSEKRAPTQSAGRSPSEGTSFSTAW